jgi:uncharacterized protein (DUF362 family)/Pyruvate/2-oxoacid:ferredoxin oxidoreductase delta subunit
LFLNEYKVEIQPANNLSLSEPITAYRKSPTALLRCPDYSAKSVRSALRRAMDYIGPLERFVRPGDSVLLKPNMLSAKEPERAVTTHPELIEAVGEMVLDCRGKIMLGDSPAGATKNIEHFWEKTGFSRAAKRLGIKPTSFEESGIKSFPAPSGHFSISRTVLEVDAIINLPKLKTHILTRMTGAVKNTFGCIPGYRKAGIHHQAPMPLPFSRFIFAIYQQVHPCLNIMDAIIGMEGNGPSSGTPRQLNAILVSEDGLALDSVAARLVKIELRKLPIFQAALEVNAWSFSDVDSQIIGDELGELQVESFKAPDISRMERIPKFVQKGLQKVLWIRPKADSSRCTSCRACIDNCPEEAMTLKDGIPKIDYQRCVKCGCCDEICPENAIYQNISPLAKLIS